MFAMRAAVGAVSGAIGGYISSGGCWESAAIGAIAGAFAGAIIPNPKATSSIGSLAAGFTGSAAGQYASSVANPCGCDNDEEAGPDLADRIRDGWKNVDLGLAGASGMGAALPGALLRNVMSPQIRKSPSVMRDFGIGAVEGLGAGVAELGYNRLTSK